MVKKIKLQPDDFEQQTSTVWSFPRRGNWATHNSKYRGNWSPDVVRNLILRYSNPWDLLLDPMIGGGTTAIECKLLNRNLIAYDINPNAIELTTKAIDFDIEDYGLLSSSQWQEQEDWNIIEQWEIRLKLNDSRSLDKIKDNYIDFVLNHPPYVDIIKYSDGIVWDLSQIHSLEKFCDEYEKAIKEFYRVLKPGKFCAILIWDTRREKMYQPLAFMVLQRFLKTWFKLKEDIVKVQHNCQATWFWKNNSLKHNFLLIMHEHLFIFQK